MTLEQGKVTYTAKTRTTGGRSGASRSFHSRTNSAAITNKANRNSTRTPPTRPA